MPITHEWNGTVLTITSDSGTSSADLKGAKGDDGARGAQGKPGSSIAEDTEKLGGIDAVEYALKTDTAPNAAKLGGVDAAEYALKVDTAPNAEMLGGVSAADYVLKTETVNNAAMLNGKPSAFYENPHNILDNSDFSKPINQRGQTTYTNVGICIDRYNMWYEESGSLTVNDGYITFTSSKGGTLNQRFPVGTLDENKKYTLIIKYGDGITVNNNPGLRFGDDYEAISIGATNNNSIDIYWAALYEGTYTADNYPQYVPKGYAAELAECQRHYIMLHALGQVIGHGYSISATDARIIIQTPQVMRGSAKIDRNIVLSFRGGGISANFTSYTNAGENTLNGMRFNVVGQNLPINYALVVYADKDFGLSCEL